MYSILLNVPSPRKDLEGNESPTPHLRHLYLKTTGMAFGGLAKLLPHLFPDLETLTFVLETVDPFGWFNEEGQDFIPEEQGGELNIEGFLNRRRAALKWLMRYAGKMLASVDDECWRRRLRVRWRLLEQFGAEVEEGWKGLAA